MNATKATQLTYRYDRLRAISSGIIDSANTTFFLLIAVKAFDADATSKSLIAAGGNIGLLLTLWLVPIAARIAKPPTHLASLLLSVSAIAFSIAAIFPTLLIYVPACMTAMACANIVIPLITTAYQQNYPPRERGKYVSRTLIIRVALAALFGEIGGRLLTQDLEYFRWMIAAFALAFAFSAWCVRRMPSTNLASAESISAIRSMRFIRTDRTLRFTLVSWMLMGFANLMMFPLRVEYLANPRFGIALDPQQIALYTITIPSLVRLLLTPLWGWLFDRMNFFVMRILLNIGFAIGTAAFFVGDSVAGLTIGAVVFGAAAAGGELAWSLWTTKFSPPDRVAEYMSVHTFFTGLRGVFAPVVAFQLINALSIAVLGVICAAMIVAASMILLPELKPAK
jgi:MFS family permease